MSQPEIIVGIGGAAGDGVASAGNTLVLSLARQGLAAYSYNSYQSVIRGGHSWLRLRFSASKPLNQGDQVDAVVALNQDTLDRHLQELQPGGLVLYNGAKLSPSYDPPPGVQLCPLPVPDLAPGIETAAGHAEHRGGRGPDAPDGPRDRRPRIGAAVDLRQEAGGRGVEHRRRAGRVRLRAGQLPVASRRSCSRPTRSGPRRRATTCSPWAPRWPAASSTWRTR